MQTAGRYRGDAEDKGWRRGGTPSWWGDGHEGGWQGDGQASKRSPEGHREREKEADSEKGSNEKETIRKIGRGLVSRGLTIQKDLVHKFQRIQDGNKASLRKTYHTQTEANEEVWELNESTEKATSQMAEIFETYEAVGKDVLDVDWEIDDKCDMTDVAAKMVMEAAETADEAAKMVMEAAEKADGGYEAEKAWRKTP